MRYANYSFLLFTLTLFPACSFFKSDIKEINSIKEVQSIFDTATKDDLFVFDVDDVILEPTEPPIQSRFHQNKELDKIIDDFMAFRKTKGKGVGFTGLFFSKMSLKIKFQPVEKKLIDAILAIQRRNVKVIALTALNTEKCGLINRLEEFRYKQLLDLGLDFSKSFKQQDVKLDELQETEFAAKYKAKTGRDAKPVVFYKGIACTSIFPKGIVLKTILEKFGYRPAQIYFFDDRRKNTESVAQEMKKMGIACQAFVYKAATVNRPMDGLDIEVARFQHELMKQRDDDDYVGYFEAKEILEKQKSLHKKTAGQPVQATP